MSTFAEKLNALMQIAYVSNVKLANAISIDQSHLSRLRRGQRKLPRKTLFLPALSDYISAEIKSPEQISAIFTLTDYQGEITDRQALSQHLADWLVQKEGSEFEKKPQTIQSKSFSMFLHGLDSFHPESDAFVYVGEAYQRKAMMKLLEMAVESDEVKTLYFYSEDSWDWLEKDAGYLKSWLDLMLKLASQGKEIVAVFFFNRKVTELVTQVSYWMRLHMTGQLRAYYYPRVTDSLYNRSLFSAYPVGALNSFTMQASESETWGYFTRNQAALRMLEEEREIFLKHCLPLVKILRLEGGTEFRQEIEAFKDTESPLIINHEVPDFYNMPKDLLREMLDDKSFEIMLPYWELAQELFTQHIQQNKAIEFVKKPELVLEKEQMPLITLMSLILKKEIRYSKEHYLRHIEHLRALMQKWTNYQAYQWDVIYQNVFITTKNNANSIVATTGEANSLFVLTDQRLNNAVFDHLNNRTRRASLL